MLANILVVVAFVCFTLAALRPAHPDWNRLVAAGLAAFTLVGLV